MKKLSLLLVMVMASACLFLCCCNTEETPEEVPQHKWVLQETEFDGTVNIHTQYQCSECGETKTVDVKNIILFIGDGMGPEHLKAGQLASDTPYAFTDWQHTMVNTVNAEGEITDSAASGTAMATGTLTTNKSIGKNPDGEDLTTILDIAKQKGMRTGIVTTDYLYGATPAAFSGHAPNRDSATEIIFSQLKSEINLLCASFTGTVAYRTSEIDESGYILCDKFSKRDAVANVNKALCQFDLEGYGKSVKLCEAVTFALDHLENENGFVLLIEQAHIDKYSHDFWFPQVLQAMNSLKDAMDAVCEWTSNHNDTAIMVTADHETGGLVVSEENTLAKNYTASNGVVLYYEWTADYHTDTNVDFYYHGFQANINQLPFYGRDDLIKNSDVFFLMKALLDEIHTS